jgi:hypothetical protein
LAGKYLPNMVQLCPCRHACKADGVHVISHRLSSYILGIPVLSFKFRRCGTMSSQLIIFFQMILLKVLYGRDDV